MATYVALLRAVNVSGKNKLPMADLREVLATAGFENVRTHVQSGNVIVDAKGTRVREIETTVHALIEKHFGLTIPVIARTRSQWAKVTQTDHFAKSDTKQRYFGFLEKKPGKAAIERLGEISRGADSYVVVGSEIYLDLPSGAGSTKLTNAAIESKLGVKATCRNWRSLMAIAELAGC